MGSGASKKAGPMAAGGDVTQGHDNNTEKGSSSSPSSTHAHQPQSQHHHQQPHAQTPAHSRHATSNSTSAASPLAGHHHPPQWPAPLKTGSGAGSPSPQRNTNATAEAHVSPTTGKVTSLPTSGGAKGGGGRFRPYGDDDNTAAESGASVAGSKGGRLGALRQGRVEEPAHQVKFDKEKFKKANKEKFQLDEPLPSPASVTPTHATPAGFDHFAQTGAARRHQQDDDNDDDDGRGRDGGGGKGRFMNDSDEDFMAEILRETEFIVHDRF
ncbi:uncharacterized protein EV422DRAFT_295089 [Fimicolochytrium jonesii]|uniref:uncharacterized protein n=1 Tax=Fimicolochytrium jonesii TaxID=1396493 RepID=UPI0022FE8746|nr:uncharacterized protein EV422DRAFT_295089 [Fimicolochytrium jonesii]KAI8816286.1 hypothetical protein EV422DRAFT_295089 [Fimicolochytrium jonesii]